MSGVFITFEGGEGVGKSTQIKRLASWLEAKDYQVVVTREPGGSPSAEQIRALLLDPSLELDGTSQSLLFAAARREHIRVTIAPALAKDRIVLCDRFADSTRAYQGVAGNVDAAVLAQLDTIATGALTPDLTLILDAPVEMGLARAAMRRNASSEAIPDRFERETIAYHNCVRSAFHQIARDNPERCVLIDAADGADQVFLAIRQKVERCLQRRGGAI